MSGVGATALGIKGVVAAGYTLVWAGTFITFVTAPMANALRMGSEITRHLGAGFAALLTFLLQPQVVIPCHYGVHLPTVAFPRRSPGRVRDSARSTELQDPPHRHRHPPTGGKGGAVLRAGWIDHFRHPFLVANPPSGGQFVGVLQRRIAVYSSETCSAARSTAADQGGQ